MTIKLERKEEKLDRYIIPKTSDLEELVDACDPEAVFAAIQLEGANLRGEISFGKEKHSQSILNYENRLLDMAEKFADKCSCSRKGR